MILGKETILELIKKEPSLIEEMIDSDIQIQESGIDLTIGQISDLYGRGTIDFDNKNRFIPYRTEIYPEYDENLDTFCYGLSPGLYSVEVREKVNMPKDIVGRIEPRLSLVKSGVKIESGLIESGYSGHIEILLHVINDYGITLSSSARICQIIFENVNKITDGYKCIYSDKIRKNRFDGEKGDCV